MGKLTKSKKNKKNPTDGQFKSLYKVMAKSNFKKIYEESVPRLKAFLRQGWSISEEDIEEIIHDVLIILYNKSRFSYFKWNKSWLYKTTFNKAIDRIRSFKNTEESLDSSLEPVSNVLTPEEELLNHDQREWINNFLRSLDQVNRKIAYLYYYEDISCRKIASIIRIPVGTVKYRLFNIRKLLEEEYTAYEKK